MGGGTWTWVAEPGCAQSGTKGVSARIALGARQRSRARSESGVVGFMEGYWSGPDQFRELRIQNPKFRIQ